MSSPRLKTLSFVTGHRRNSAARRAIGTIFRVFSVRSNMLPFTSIYFFRSLEICHLNYHYTPRHLLLCFRRAQDRMMGAYRFALFIRFFCFLFFGEVVLYDISVGQIRPLNQHTDMVIPKISITALPEQSSKPRGHGWTQKRMRHAIHCRRRRTSSIIFSSIGLGSGRRDLCQTHVASSKRHRFLTNGRIRPPRKSFVSAEYTNDSRWW